MKTPQIPPLAGMTPLGFQPGTKRRAILNAMAGHDPDPRFVNPLSRDQAALAQRKANSPLMAPKPQIPCDHGLFSDDATQLDLADMPMFNDAIEEE